MYLRKKAIICVENIAYNEKKFAHQPESAGLQQYPRLYLLHTGGRLCGADGKKQARDAGYEVKSRQVPVDGHPAKQRASDIPKVL